MSYTQYFKMSPLTNKYQIISMCYYYIKMEGAHRQGRMPFTEPSDAGVRYYTQVLLYCSHYYPLSRPLLNKLLSTHDNRIHLAIIHLYNCLQREIIYGPSSSYIPPNDVPESCHKDMHMTAPNEPLQREQLPNYLQLQDAEVLRWYTCDKLLSMSQSHEFYSKLYEEQLDMNGENILQATPLKSLFCVVRNCVKHYSADKNNHRMQLIMARMSLLHNRLLKHPVNTLCEEVLSNYRSLLHFARSNKSPQLPSYCQLLLEYSYALLFYYKYAEAEEALKTCSKIEGVTLELTGKMGRRTKYQQFDTPQLVASVKKPNQEQYHLKPQFNLQNNQYNKEQLLLIQQSRNLVLKQINPDFKSALPLIEQSKYEQDSILFQTPKLVQEEQYTETVKNTLSSRQELVLLCDIHHTYRSVPHDEMLYQHISACLLTLSPNFSTLLLRSLNEFPRVKHTERALHQMQSLNDHFLKKKECSEVYSTPYETQLTYSLLLASKYMELGMSLTAVELYKRAKLYEQCIDALVTRDYKEQAMELLTGILRDKGKSPRRLCMQADITNEINLYTEAWELSKCTYGRAMRSLAWQHYSKKNYSQAAECFTLSLKPNRYHPSTWFTLGCCYMNLSDYKAALKAFSECIVINEKQGETWGNMGGCYMHLQMWNEAYTTLCQAVRHAESMWKLWANLLAVSIKVKQFYKFIDTIAKLVALNHHQVITASHLERLKDILLYQLQTQTRKRVIYNYKDRIDKLFVYLKAQIGQMQKVFRGECAYLTAVIQYTHHMNEHYSTNQDLNDMVPGFEHHAKADVASVQMQLVQAKLTELNMSMKIGWNLNKEYCKTVQALLNQYISLYQTYSPHQNTPDFQLFVKGMKDKINACLQDKEIADLK